MYMTEIYLKTFPVLSQKNEKAILQQVLMSQELSQESFLSLWDEYLEPGTQEEPAPLPTDISQKPADHEITSPATSLDTDLRVTVTPKQWKHLRAILPDSHLFTLRFPKSNPNNPKPYRANDFLSKLPESLELLDSSGLAPGEGTLKRKRSRRADSKLDNEDTGNLDKDGKDLEFKKVRRE
jgi:hypothetical protein